MTRYELRRVAQMYGASEEEVREAEYEAVCNPLVPLSQVYRSLRSKLICPESSASCSSSGTNRINPNPC